MKLSQKTKNILIVAYILFFVFGALYINSISKYTKIEQVDNNKNSDSKENKVVKVTLIINNSTTYTETLKTSDSVSALLDEVRKNENFTYEITNYTYGTEIDSINGQIAPNGFRWEILLNGKDITHDINNIELVNKSVYEINLVKL